MKIGVYASCALLVIFCTSLEIVGQVPVRSTLLGQNSVAPGPVQAVTVKRMRLLDQDTGWVSSDSRVFMTRDGGESWKDISPPPRHRAIDANLLKDRFSDVFFLDANVGWTLAKTAPDETGDFVVSRTVDGGAHWSTSNLVVPESDPSHGGHDLTGNANIVFADRLHGWLSADDSSNTLNTSSVLLRTSDGGLMWTPTENGGDGTIDAMEFASRSLWLLCRVGNESELLVSRDGARKVEDVAFSKPKELGAAEDPQFSLPVFIDRTHGYEAVTYTDYSHGTKWQSSAVLYETADGGLTWRTGRILSGFKGHEKFVSTVAGTNWIYSTVNGNGMPVLKAVESASGAVVQEHSTGDFSKCALDFATPTVGWTECSGRLLSTIDGGNTWREIAPHLRDGRITVAPISTYREDRGPIVTEVAGR
jgi:photosystem II stability/assembly factor-like uncharacterized protein